MSRLTVVAEGLLVLGVIAAPWPYGSAIDPARYALAAGLWLVTALWLLGRPQPGAGAPLLAAAGIPAVCLVQIVFGRSSSTVFTCEAILIGGAMIGTLLFVRERASDLGGAGRIAAAVLAVGTVQAAFGAYSWSVSPTRIYGRAHPEITMPFGSFVTHNHFAGLVAMTALLALGMAAGHARRAHAATPVSVACGGAALAMAAGLVASRSRGGLLALAGGAVVLGLAIPHLGRDRGPDRRRRGVVAAGVLALAVLGFGLAVATPAARQRLATILRGPSDQSGGYRQDTAAATLRLFMAHPLLGAGFGAYEDAVTPFKRGHGEVRTTHAESDVLEVLSEGGLLGVAAVAWLAVVLWRGLRSRLERGRDPFRKGIAVGAWSGACALGVHSLVDFNLRIPSNALLFVVLLGLASAPVVANGASLADAAWSGARARRGLAALALLLALAAAWRAAGAVQFERALALADANERVQALDAVLARHPYLAEAWRERGVAWRQLGTPLSPLRGARLQRSFDDLSRAVQLRPGWGEAWSDRGWLAAMRGDLSRAAQDLRHARALDPTHPGIALVASTFEQALQVR